MNGRAPLGYSLPVDSAGWIALGAAALALVLALLVARKTERIPLRLWVGCCSAAAAALSFLWISYYLRGGPRIIDASSYWLEARAMSHGLFTWPVEPPSASLRGRFLLASPDGSSLGVIFPPGWPAVLALGFALGAPLAIGPAIAAALVAATSMLARQLSSREEPARIAAVLSAASACLRYHTADTMSHGLSALCWAGALGLALHARRCQGRSRFAAMAGFGMFSGLLLATRPASFLALAVVSLGIIIALSAGSPRDAIRSAPALAAASLAGFALPALLLLLHQHAVTGQWLASSQSAYYLLADGPPGCFRYGFGAGIGCLAEHEPYVRSVLPHGHDLRSALITAGRRLHLHLSDVANAEPLFLLVPIGAWISRRNRVAIAVACAPLILLGVYAPFYFDGSYPGGGARFLADAIPAEHAIMAIAIASIAGLGTRPDSRRELRAIGVVVSLMLLGFAVRTSREHASLRERDGGRPFFDPQVVARAGATSGLLFVDGDHAFNLAYDPAVNDPAGGLVVRRARGDERDRLAWEKLGKPPAFRFRMDPWSKPPVEPHVEPWSPPAGEPGLWRFEGEAEWPPLEQSGGYAVPTWLAQGSCVSGGLALGLTRTDKGPVCVVVEIPWPDRGEWEVRVHMITGERPHVHAWLDPERESGDEGRLPPVDPWQLDESKPLQTPRTPDGRRCLELSPIRVRAKAKSGLLNVCSDDPWAGLDAVVLGRPTPNHD